MMPAHREGYLPPVGAYKVNVLKCEEKISQAGNAMLVFTVEIAKGEESEGYEMTDFLVSGNKYYNDNCGKLFAAFGLEPNQVPTEEMFEGKSAVVQLKHEDYVNKAGETRTKAVVHYWLPASLTEPARASHMAKPAGNSEPVDDCEDDVPF